MDRKEADPNMQATDMQTRKASIKETGEELSQAEWERFDAAVAAVKEERRRREGEVVRAAREPRRG